VPIVSSVKGMLLEDLRHVGKGHRRYRETEWWAGGDLNSRSPGVLRADNQSARPKPGIIAKLDHRPLLDGQSFVCGYKNNGQEPDESS